MDFYTDEEIGTIIKNKRISLDMTQRVLGEKLGVQPAAVQKWESGKVMNIKRSVLRQLALELRISPTVLIGIKEEE